MSNNCYKKLIILIILVLSLTACSQNESVVLVDNHGHHTKFSALKGKWIIFNYWATWCHYCVKEIPELNKFFEQNKKHNVAIFGVNYDGLTGAMLKKAVRVFSIQYPVLLVNPAKQLNFGTVTVLPTTFIFNPDGELIKKLVGPQTVASLDKIIHGGKYDG